MSAADRLDFDLTSETERLAAIRDELRRWLPPRGWSAEQTGEIVLAVDEALANVIRHGYDSQPAHPIVMCVRSILDPQAGEGVEIEIRDFGRQIAPEHICGRSLDTPRPGGLGVHLIRASMSDVSYSRADGGGMRLVMRKYRTHTVQHNAGQAGAP